MLEKSADNEFGTFFLFFFFSFIIFKDRIERGRSLVERYSRWFDRGFNFSKFQFSRKRKSIFNHRFHRVLINLKYFFRACCVRFAEWLQRRERGGMGEREKKRRNEVGAKSTTRLPPSTDP